MKTKVLDSSYVVWVMLGWLSKV